MSSGLFIRQQYDDTEPTRRSTIVTAQPVLAPAAAARSAAWAPPDLRRWLQLGLAAVWVLDGVLQYQSLMFTRAFGQMLAGSADGNPAVLAESIRWAAGIVERSPSATNAAFATIQLALGLGIAWRPALRPALAASVAWSVAVWWFGEGLGGVLNGTASPVNGAPGAVILYALLAILIWPAAGRGSFVAARPLGAGAARGLWVLLWGSLAYFSVTPASRAAQGLHDMIAGMAGGEPAWLASVDRGAAGVLAHHGLAASIALAAVLAVIAAGIFLPAPGARAMVLLAVVVSLVIWVVGQDLGEILAGNATDVESGPLLVLIALAYWPPGGGRGRLGRRLRPAVPAPAGPGAAFAGTADVSSATGAAGSGAGADGAGS
jgi:hypothetical protein